MKYHLSWLLIAIITMTCLVAPNQGLAETNGIAVGYERPVYRFPFDLPDNNPLLKFPEELVRNRDIVIDKIGAPTLLSWTRRENREGYALNHSWNSAGANAVGQLIGNSARETALVVFPVEEWEQSGILFMESIWGLVFDSVGNTTEERTSLVTAEYSEADITWWQQLRQDKKVSFGVRPLRRDPYFYTGFSVGHWDGQYGTDKPIMILEVRARYDLFNSGKFEASITFPLPESFQLSVGVSSEPVGRDSRGFGIESLSVRLGRVLRVGNETSIIYLGMSSGPRETMVSARIDLPG